jgi:3-dehydroquinate synthase
MRDVLDFTFHKNIESNVAVYVQRGGIHNLAALLPDIQPDKVFVVCDENVEALYGKSITASLRERFEAHLIVHKADEHNKNLEALTSLSNAFFEAGGTSRSCICAVGGGITGNIAGLLSTIVYRGITLVHVPTTLLAQLDSAADVKQSVNAPGVKNAIGAYKAPSKVVVDSEVLNSLSDREIRSGLGEAVKHGFAQDLKLVNAIVDVDRHDLAALEKIIRRTIELKIDHWNHTPTIWNDPQKVERLTHLGHTTGKILEMIEVDHLTHGEAIAHGMVIEGEVSNILGYLSEDDVEYMRSTLQKIGLLYPLTKNYTASSVLSGLYSSGKRPLFAVLKVLGSPEALSLEVPQDVLAKAIEKYPFVA